MPLPEFTPDPIHIVGPITIAPFGMAVATGVLIGSSLAVARAEKRGLSRIKIESLITWVLVSGFVNAHVLDVVMYRPEEIVKTPLELVMIHHSLSSFGGFIGAALGAIAWKLRYRERILPYVDQLTAVFPISWIFGRAGCSMAHDHLGKISDSPLAVAFKHGPPRYDLGILEFFCTIPIALVIYLYARKPRKAGAITGLLCMIYAPIRFPLDALRATDVRAADLRYAGLTPAQWLTFGLFALGAWLFWQSRKPETPLVGASPAAPPATSTVTEGS